MDRKHRDRAAERRVVVAVRITVEARDWWAERGERKGRSVGQEIATQLEATAGAALADAAKVRGAGREATPIPKAGGRG